MKLLVKQPAGLGDIFFCQKIAHEIAKKENAEVIWPVLPQFSYLQRYLRPRVESRFPSVDQEFQFKYLYERGFPITLRTTHALVLNLHGHTGPEGVMKAKYDRVGLDFHDWKDYFHFTRDREREQQLMDELAIKDGDDIALLNPYFASPPDLHECGTLKVLTRGIPGKKTVLMRVMEGFNVFDWCGVIERASEIHTVETSICYIMEHLSTTNKLFMYSRNQYPPDWTYINGIYSKPWTYER